eukprot:CAMPEP_0197262966 /NCGR_PEP_ID=MMETSP1432-20130617/824_1 /TAXON_ID=44447 /ORGANISM="Pseudo-nitzschia delicatissima, Strain UNC1205" /LENGTH=836 /DNA_ID=CAMNT_0042727345 /DNA_START=24 /DNA_END=2534 /DNA_ORIENTATION=-
MSSFLEINKDFVLKLKIQTAGQSQIRRVSLPRIADASGNISYEELVGLVLEFSLPEEDASKISTRNYTVTLTYFDDEKDLITLASIEELVEAIELFAGQKFIRITTCVKPKISHAAPPPSARPYVQDTQDATNTNDANYPSDLPIETVLESFAGILSSAVNTLQEGLANQSQPSPKAPQSKPTEASPAFKSKLSAKRAALNKKGAHEKGTKKTPTSSANSVSLKTENKTTCAAPKKEIKPPVVSTDNKKSPAKKEAEYKKTFIHGRHTCDGCLTTPIVGKRYHATNLPDYDVCQKCFDNYKGSEIKYEPVELRHDMPLQIHWRMRQERKERMFAVRNRSARRVGHYPCAPPRFGPAKTARPVPKPAPTNTVSTPPTNACTQNNAFTYAPDDFDDSLKEAIRRSLDDVAPKEDATMKAKEDEENKEAEKLEQTISDSQKHSSNLVTKIEERMKAAEEKVPREIKVMVYYNVSEKDVDDEDDFPRSVDIPENNTADIDIPGSVDIPEINTDDIERLQSARSSGHYPCEPPGFKPPPTNTVSTPPTNAGERLASCDSISEKRSVSLEVGDEEALQNAMDTDSVDSEKLVAESEDLPTDTPTSKNTFKNESFASDAVGNGDVAEMMGKALDMVAGAIGEMLEESGEMVSQMLEETGELVKVSQMLEETGELLKESEVMEATSKDDKVPEDEPKDGEIIVDSSDDVEEANEEEDETDWSVVKSVGSNGTTESQQIGRAAEMLGSALFNSDMKTSPEGMVSSLVPSDSSFSVPSSVPTDLGTVNTRLEGSNGAPKWATELTKLKELGFDNEEICIEVLERVRSELSTDEINLDVVVSQLLFF